MKKILYRRILLKLSGEVFSEQYSSQTDIPEMIASVLEEGVQVGIVLGGGNILRGASFKDIPRPEADTAGMLATCINGILLRATLRNYGMDPVLMVPPPASYWAEETSAHNAILNLEKGKPVIFSGGTGNPYFTTDTAAVLRALEINANVLVKGTKVDGVFDHDPAKNKSAKFIPRLTHEEALKRKLKIMDSTAFSLAADNHLPIVVFNFNRKGALLEVVKGEKVGTLVTEGGFDDPRNS
jgi:uridylate kinase